MAKFTLPIKHSYVAGWGAWECVREFIQNAKDEEQQHGHAMTVGHFGKVLCIANAGASIDRKALLLGHTTKGDGNLRGKFGEGLNLALLVAARIGYKTSVSTPTETWVPSIEFSKEYGEDCLVISTRAHGVNARPRTGVEIQIEMPEEEWLRFKGRFLFLSKLTDTQVVRVPNQGSILLEEERKGQVYVRGIYITTMPKLSCGYDLDTADLDRDRRMIDAFDLQWKLGAMYQEALARRPELMGHRVYKMMRDNAHDTQYLTHHAPKGEAAEQLAARFREEHGDKAIPCNTLAESRELEHSGRRGVIVPDALRSVLAETSIGSVEKVKAAYANEVTKTYVWADLTPAERERIEKQCADLDRILHTNVFSVVQIADFGSDTLLALRKGPHIFVARHVLQQTSAREFMAALVHEMAHLLTGAGDGEKAHVMAIEETWSRLYFNEPLPEVQPDVEEPEGRSHGPGLAVSLAPLGGAAEDDGSDVPF